MATTKLAYASNTAITCTLNSLASSATVGRASTKVDNTTNLYLDALVSGIFVYGSGSLSGDEAVYVYAYGSTDLSNYTEGVTGSDAGFTINNPTGLKLIGAVPVPTVSLTYYGGPWDVAAAFGGILPAYWGVVVVQYTGIAHAASGNSLNYTGITSTTA